MSNSTEFTELPVKPLQPQILGRMWCHNPSNDRVYLPPTLEAPDTSVNKKYYTILFDEGDGYLFVDYLGMGSYSVTMLVMSLADGRTYVRKLHDLRVVRTPHIAMCEDQFNAVNQNNVPKLIDSTYYDHMVPHTIKKASGQDKPIWCRYVTAATIWELCNGGPMSRLFHLPSHRTGRIPEPVMWKLFADLLESLLNLSRSGVAHADVHPGNILLQWSPSSLIPSLYLTDFGLARRIPQQTNDVTYNIPFEAEMIAYEKWYSDVRSDMTNAIEILAGSLLLPRYSLPVADAEQGVIGYLRKKVFQRSSINGYSLLLTEKLAYWDRIIRFYWNRPADLRNSLMMLYHEVKNQTVLQTIQFNKLPIEQQRSHVQWMRSSPTKTTPAMWTNPRPLFKQEWFQGTRMDPRDLYKDESKRFIDFTPVLEGNFWRTNNREIHIQRPGGEHTLCLRRSEFRVAEIAYDETVGRWYLLREVDSSMI